MVQVLGDGKLTVGFVCWEGKLILVETAILMKQDGSARRRRKVIKYRLGTRHCEVTSDKYRNVVCQKRFTPPQSLGLG
jgi:hypothetical protein